MNPSSPVIVPPSSTPIITPTAVTPRMKLVGLTLQSGWHIDEILQNTANSSGGNFGTGYKASKGDARAFIKAIDFVNSIEADDPLKELQKLLYESNFEREVLEYCASQRMDRVLQYIDHEYIFVGDSGNPLNRVSCLIMEAGSEDLRRLIGRSTSISCSWSIFVLRDVAKALSQLHAGGISHQDVKPSNVIALESLPASTIGKSTPMKIGDLGRVVRRNSVGPYDSYTWPGDRRYCPPERLYGHVPTDWNDAREASDAYMLGSLFLFLYTGMSLQILLSKRIPPAFQAAHWGGAYDSDLIPVLLNATYQVLEESLRPCLPSSVASELLDIVKDLTHPDPTLRGDKKARRQSGRPVGIERIYQKLNILALKSAANERGRNN